jgi:biopolymer transport protein ExbB
MLEALWDGIRDLWVAGGFVMPPLFALTAALWYALGWRLLALRRGDTRALIEVLVAGRAGAPLSEDGIVTGAVLALVRAGTDGPGASVPALRAHLAGPRAAVRTGQTLVRSIVAVAPLLGLLGTVTGMIETFRSLGEMELFTQGGGVAGGIGEALLTTQMGLAVSVPGLIVGRLLDRKQVVLEDELDQLEELARTPAREAA